MANAIAKGNATKPTVTPASASDAKVGQEYSRRHATSRGTGIRAPRAVIDCLIIY